MSDEQHLTTIIGADGSILWHGTPPAPVRHCGDETEHAAHVWTMPDGDRFACVGTDAAGAAIAKRSRFAGGFAELAPAPIVWGSTLCTRKRCAELATCSVDGVPFCIPHADETIERACVDPEFARRLPELDE